MSHDKQKLYTSNENFLKEMIEEDGKAELVCHFCNKKYEFSKEELEDKGRHVKSRIIE